MNRTLRWSDNFYWHWYNQGKKKTFRSIKQTYPRKVMHCAAVTINKSWFLNSAWTCHISDMVNGALNKIKTNRTPTKVSEADSLGRYCRQMRWDLFQEAWRYRNDPAHMHVRWHAFKQKSKSLFYFTLNLLVCFRWTFALIMKNEVMPGFCFFACLLISCMDSNPQMSKPAVISWCFGSKSLLECFSTI